MGELFESVQGNSGEKVNIFGGYSVSHCVKKGHMNKGLILNGNRVRGF